MPDQAPRFRRSMFAGIASVLCRRSSRSVGVVRCWENLSVCLGCSVALWAVVAVAIVLVVRATQRPIGDAAVADRFTLGAGHPRRASARGEIDTDEYQQQSNDLGARTRR